MTGFTAELAERSSSLTFDDLPADVADLAGQCLLDWFGVTVAGSQEPASRILLDVLSPISDGVTVIGTAVQLAPMDAALVNGTASHALDYDDVNEAMVGHPSVPILGGLLALAESIGGVGASGADVLCAFVAGYETQCRVGRAVGVDHSQRGFHATGTVGTFGSAAACARLLGLDAPTTAIALGLAAAQAAGLKSMFGTMTKPLHAGKACVNGLLAARLAAGGFTAAPDGIETAQGFAEAAAGGVDAERGLREPRNGWFIRDNLFKYHAACFQTHSSIEGLRRLREAERFTAGDVESATIHADAMQLRMCAIPAPRTGLEVKFSLRHTGALALLGRDTSAITTYTDDCANDPEVVSMRDRVTVADDGAVGGPTPVEVHLRDGRVFSAAHDVSTPEADLDKQRALLQDKCTALVAPVLGEDAAAALVGELEHVEKLDSIGRVMRMATR